MKLVWLIAPLALALPLVVLAQSGAPASLHEHPAISYSTRTPTDRIAKLNAQLESGGAALTFAAPNGYLKSALDLLHVASDSQVVVFSKTSLQSDLIAPKNPRAIYFSDDVAVGWVRGADSLELVAQDKDQGAIFYTLGQTPGGKPRFARTNDCLLCHLSPDTEGVPGFLMFSQFSIPTDQYSYATGSAVDHRTSFHERWGGWYVTGRSAGRHLGNILDLRGVDEAAKRPGRQLDSLAREFDASVYLTPFSDVVALLVLEHQVKMADMLTRIGWAARIAAEPSRPAAHGAAAAAPGDSAGDLKALATDVVDYMLFVDEAPLPGPVQPSNGFAQRFSSLGPRDRQGRSLRELDLQRRLMKYPCSYMVYSETFEALPGKAKEAIYQRLWQVLSGQDAGVRYRRLTQADRRAVVDILVQTKADIPAYFRQGTP